MGDQQCELCMARPFAERVLVGFSVAEYSMALGCGTHWSIYLVLLFPGRLIGNKLHG